MSEGITVAVTGLVTVFIALTGLMVAIQLIGWVVRRLPGAEEPGEGKS